MLNKLEKKLGKFAIKNLSYYIMIIYVIGAIIGVTIPSIYFEYLALDFSKIASGQIWRLFTFILYPQITSLSIINIIFGIICIYLYYYIGTMLEHAWGTFRFNVYYLSGIILNIIGMLIIYLVTGQSISFGMTYIQNSMFLAFASLVPDSTMRLYFIIPIKMKWLGYFYGIVMGIEIILNFLTFTVSGIACAIAMIISILNFIVYFISSRKRKKITRVSVSIVKQPKHIEKPKQLIHKCAICGKTKEQYPDLEFRYCSKCSSDLEYCEEHIFKHEHK